MRQLRVLMLLGLCFTVPAHAGLFSDDEARQEVKDLEARVLKLEPLQDVVKQQTKSLLDMQTQIDQLNAQLRDLRGQNEELAHGLQDAEKREKDFYVDLDTRVRRFESPVPSNQPSTPTATNTNSPSVGDITDPTQENHAIEAAYAWVSSGNNDNALKALQGFIKNYPNSVYVSTALYWMGNTQFKMGDAKSALTTYDKMLSSYPDAPRAADAMLNKADCLKTLNQNVAARRTLKQLISKYPSTPAADKAHKLLAGDK